MPLLGVNAVSDAPNRPTTLDRIATGVDIASKILGTGAGLYGSYWKGQESAQNIATQKQTQDMNQERLGLEERNLGLTDTPDSSLFPPGKDPQKFNDQQIADYNNTLPKDPQTGQYLAPVLVRIPRTKKVMAQQPGWQVMSPNEQMLFKNLMENKVFASAKDPKGENQIFPNGIAYRVKDKPLSPAEKANTQLSNQSSFESNSNVVNYNEIYRRAANAATVANLMVNGKHIDQSLDQTLAGDFLKSISLEGGRVSPEGIVQVTEQSENKKDAVIQQLKKWGLIPGQEVGNLSDKARAEMILAIKAREATLREGYDRAFLDAHDFAQIHGTSFSKTPAPKIRLPDLEPYLKQQPFFSPQPGAAQAHPGVNFLNKYKATP